MDSWLLPFDNRHRQPPHDFNSDTEITYTSTQLTVRLHCYQCWRLFAGWSLVDSFLLLRAAAARRNQCRILFSASRCCLCSCLVCCTIRVASSSWLLLHHHCLWSSFLLIVVTVLFSITIDFFLNISNLIFKQSQNRRAHGRPVAAGGAYWHVNSSVDHSNSIKISAMLEPSC